MTPAKRKSAERLIAELLMPGSTCAENEAAAILRELLAEPVQEPVAAERERCAAICDVRSADHWRAYGDKTSPHFCDARFEAFSDEADECAKAIRASAVSA